MLFKTTALLLLSGAIVHADNTPNLCSDDISNLQRIAPSATGLDIDPIPDIKVGSATYSGDAEHFVMIPNDGHVKKVMVYLPGTTDRPELSSCLLKSVSETLNFPTIGLSYAYLSSGDNFRNGKCASLEPLAEQVLCLQEQHTDAIDGGDYGATHFTDSGSAFWVEVKPENSITARLGKLLQYLDNQNPGNGWGDLYVGDTAPKPMWENIYVMGHSQGAGHAAYLGAAKKILGASMLSGPQDECIDCPVGTDFWIDGKYKTKTQYTAFASGDEPLYPVMTDNWLRMKEAGATTWGEPTDVDFALTPVDACASPLVTHVKYAPTSTCGGKEHCSTAIDDSVPFLIKSTNETYYLYDNIVWPAIASTECKSNKMESKKNKNKTQKIKNKGTRGRGL